jgi:hypothetical protein
MNKFKRLQLAGTLVLTSPALLVSLAVIAFCFPSYPQEDLAETIQASAPEAVKADTVIIVKEIEKVAPPAPVIKKPIAVPPPPPPPIVKDTVKKVTVELDTTK